MLILRAKIHILKSLCFDYVIIFIAFYIVFSLYQEYGIKRPKITVVGILMLGK
jgi:hypothetical protein